MGKNLLLRRVILLMLSAIVLVSLIAGVLYTRQAKDMFANMKYEELYSIVSTVFSDYTLFLTGRLHITHMEKSAQLAADSSQAQLFIYDKFGKRRLFAEYSNSTPLDEAEQAKVDELVLSSTDKMVQNGTKSIAELKRLPQSREEYLLVGESVFLQLDTGETTDEVLYVIMIAKPASSVTGSLNTLNQTLIITFLLVFAAIMVPIYFASRRMMAPLSSMRDIALAMAQGDFDLRANEQQPGEIGQLSRTLNYLAGTLSQTISELKVERNRLRRIIDGLAEGIIAMDADLMITHVNPSICELLEIEVPDDPGRLCNDILPKELLDDFQRVVEDSCTVVRSYKWKNLVLRISIAPLTNDFSYTVGAVALFHDITESERLEQTRREFVANVSHELRTPLSALRGLAEVLNDDMLKNEDDKHRYYGYILRESLRLNRLIDDLLELSRLQTGSVYSHKHEFNVADAMKEIQDKYSVTADDMDIRLALDVDAERCPAAWGNLDRFEQVCVILLDNALKYTPEAGLITLGATWDDEKLYISVRDTGEGIPEEDREHVFERFYKVDKAHTGGGTGLGLSIAREIASMLDEKIWIEDSSEKGTEFKFTVGRADAHEEILELPVGDMVGDIGGDKNA